MRVFTAFAICITFLTFTGCKRNGTGGEAGISVFVKHHAAIIPGATVYIKYGAKEFPGTDVSQYDDSKVCDANGHAAFEGLLKGNYYLYATGYDSAISMSVKGGVGVQIKKKDEHPEIIVPVVE